MNDENDPTQKVAIITGVLFIFLFACYIVLLEHTKRFGAF